MEMNSTSRRELIDVVSRLRYKVCGYMDTDFCDCKFSNGKDKFYGEYNGCPELRMVELILQALDDEEFDELWEKANAEKCVVSGCTNKTNEGPFVGNMCSPCYAMITKGDASQPSNNFIHKLYNERQKC